MSRTNGTCDDGVGETRQAIRRLNLSGIVALVVLFGGVGGWAALSEIRGAVIASGSIVAGSDVREVQHPTGGVVSELLVQDGDRVVAGQVLVRIDGTAARSRLGEIEMELAGQSIRAARLAAERDAAAAVSWPLDLPSGDAVAAALASEGNLFEARRRSLQGEREQLGEQILQVTEQIGGRRAQLAAKETELALVAEQLKGVEALFARNLVAIDRVARLRSEYARLEGERGELLAAIAAAAAGISELRLRILQIEKEFVREVLNDLRDAETRIAGLRERRAAAADELRRTEIRAPIAGVVHDLAVHTVSGVIGAGDTIMLVVPQDEGEVIEAKVAPGDVDQIKPGGLAEVRVLAGNRRALPMVGGRVTMIAADLSTDETVNSPFYRVRVMLTEPAELGALALRPGMPVEVFIQTEARTALAYLLEPLAEQMSRSLRER